MEKNVHKNKEDFAKKNFCENKKKDNNSIVNSHIDRFNLKEHSLDEAASPLEIGYELKD